MTFQSNEERFEKARELARVQEQEELAAHTKKFAITGGDHLEKRSCYNCEFLHRSRDRCENKAAILMGRMLEANGLRLERGLCGPDGIFWAQDPKPAIRARKTRINIAFGLSSVAVGLSLAIFFFGLKATALVIGCLFVFFLAVLVFE